MFRGNLRWTLRSGMLCGLCAWLVFLVVFSPGRICSPLSAACRSALWEQVGDFVWLENLREWQTLIAGLIAIIAAFIGGFYINKQVQLTETLERDRQSREFEAVRALLPIHLSALVAHLTRCGETLRQIYRASAEPGVPRALASFKFRPVPMEIANFLQGVVLKAPAPVRPPIIAMLTQIQVFHARLEALEYRVGRGELSIATRRELDAYILQAVNLHAWCLAFLPFARNQSEEVPNEAMARGQYLTCLSIIGIEHAEFSSVHQLAAHVVAGMKNEWVKEGFPPIA